MEISNSVFNVERHRWKSCFNSTACESEIFLIKLLLCVWGGYQNMKNSSHVCKKDNGKRGWVLLLLIFVSYEWL